MADIEVVTIKQMEELDRLLTENKEMKAFVRKVLRSVIGKARTQVSRDARSMIANDPRQAYRAVKRMVYKRILGGNISILQKRKASNIRVNVQKERTLREGQRGGNRMSRSARTEQIDSYFGADRGFILRFLSGGTTERFAGTRDNKMARARRGNIGARNWFGTASKRAMENSAEQFCQMIDQEIERINREYNNG